jgi:hypothetical protein
LKVILRARNRLIGGRSAACFFTQEVPFTLDPKSNWNPIFEKRAFAQLGWFQPHLRSSLQLIAPAPLSRTSSIIDIGGGDPTLSLGPEGRALRLLSYDLNDLPLERFEWLILC